MNAGQCGYLQSFGLFTPRRLEGVSGRHTPHEANGYAFAIAFFSNQEAGLQLPISPPLTMPYYLSTLSR
jgi:hypothetical protein